MRRNPFAGKPLRAPANRVPARFTSPERAIAYHLGRMRFADGSEPRAYEGEKEEVGGEDRSPAELTRFLNDLRAGDEAARTVLLPELVRELRRLAERHFRREGGALTLQPTALVNEAYLKLFRQGTPDWNDRDHFFAVAARAMRQIMIDQARGRNRIKRGGDQRPVTLDEAMATAAGIDLELLDLHEGLEELEAMDPRQGRIVELKCFLGLGIEEVASVLGTSKSTVDREWRAGRAWLGRRLKKGRERG